MTSKHDRSEPKLRPAEAVAKLERMFPLVRQNLTNAIAFDAALSAGNEEIRNLRGKDGAKTPWYGAHCYNTIRSGLIVGLSLALARLFDEGSPKFPREDRDVASLPLLVWLMSADGCMEELTARARAWPIDNSREVEHAIRSSKIALEDLQASAVGKQALEALKEFRNHKLAHTLGKPMPIDDPRFEQLTVLRDAAMRIGSCASLAVAGHEWDLEDYLKERERQGRAFWSPAIAAIITAEARRP